MKSRSAYSLDTLEFGKVLDLFAKYLRTPLSLPLLRAATPATGYDSLYSRFAEMAEARSLLESGRRFAFEGIGDILPILSKASMPGSFCEGPELVRMLEALRGIRLLRRGLTESERPLGALEHYLHRILPMDELEGHMARCLESDGTLKDNASPTLARLRERIRRQRAHIQKRLEDLSRHPDIRPLLQEEYFTERNGRYVLPVQSNQKRRVRGLQHGKSLSGTTTYIEPLELVEPGNLLVEAVEEETIEVIAILKELTSQLRGQLPLLVPTFEAVAELDLVVSLAEYTLVSRSALPRIVPKGPLELHGVRHPLLLSQFPLEQVVPNDLLLEVDCAGLVITGPNTGGKTVVIKTVGLVCLLALSGLPFPCEAGTTIPLMGGVLADIGDEQSIEESLSTFSSHVARMKSFHDTTQAIQESGGYRPLVILDELGAGTDPAEGAALGRALIEDLIRQGAWVLVATHLGELKIFGYSHPGLKSGAMLFDRETLSPTYQLRMDSVGESHGLEIAQRLGLPDTLINRAEELISANPNQAVSVLHRLSEEEKRVQDIRLVSERSLAEIEEKKGTLVRRLEQTARDEKRIIDEARRQAEQKIQAAKRRMAAIEDHIKKEEEKLRRGYDGREQELERRETRITWMEKELERRLKVVGDLVRKFPNFTPDLLNPSELERIARLSEPEWKTILREINQEEDTLREEFPRRTRAIQAGQEVRPAWNEIKPGDSLRVEGIDSAVLVSRKDERKQRLDVLLGNLSMEVPYKRVLQKLGSASPGPPQGPSVRISNLFKSDTGPEINLIGMTLDEMEPLLLKYLDDASLSGRPSVRIIHGHGAGILRKGVQRILKEHPQVAKFHEASPYEGGAGATVAEMKM